MTPRDTRIDAMREAMLRRQSAAATAVKVMMPTDMALGCHVPPDASARCNNVVDMMQRELTDEELFRVAYVPFAIAELAWDYAGTVMDIALLLRIAIRAASAGRYASCARSTISIASSLFLGSTEMASAKIAYCLRRISQS